MPRKKAPSRAASAAPAQADGDASMQDSHMLSPGESETFASPGTGDDSGTGSARKKAQSRTPTPVGAGGRGRGKGLNTRHVFKATPTTSASPMSDDDFADVSRGRGTKGGRQTGVQRALLQPIDEAHTPEAVKQLSVQTTHVGAGASARGKRALEATACASTASAEAMLDEMTQDVAGQEAAPCLLFQVLHVRCVCLAGCLCASRVLAATCKTCPSVS